MEYTKTTRTPLGATFYADFRKMHPKGTASSDKWPEPAAQEVVRDALYEALQANKGPVMRERQNVSMVLDSLDKSNTREANEVCSYFPRLKSKSASMLTDGIAVVKFV